MSEPMLTESGDGAQPGGRANTAEVSLNSMQPQLPHLDQRPGQQVSYSAAPVHGQQQSLPYPGAYHMEPSHAQT